MGTEIEGVSGPPGISLQYNDSIQDSNVNVNRLTGWFSCEICEIPIPGAEAKAKHKKTHINSAIARR